MNAFTGSFLIAWGVWCVVAAFLGERPQFLMMGGDEFLFKKILGKYFAPVINLLTGGICILFGWMVLSKEFFA